MNNTGKLFSFESYNTQRRITKPHNLSFFIVNIVAVGGSKLKYDSVLKTLSGQLAPHCVSGSRAEASPVAAALALAE